MNRSLEIHQPNLLFFSSIYEEDFSDFVIEHYEQQLHLGINHPGHFGPLPSFEEMFETEGTLYLFFESVLAQRMFEKPVEYLTVPQYEGMMDAAEDVYGDIVNDAITVLDHFRVSYTVSEAPSIEETHVHNSALSEVW